MHSGLNFGLLQKRKIFMRTLIKNALIVNEGHSFKGHVLIENEIIKEVIPAGSQADPEAGTVINAEGLTLMPGMIDDQVHFREPGLTHKGDLYTEARAAVAGGITSYMEMPNTVPNTLTQELLQQKYDRAAEVSLANYSFFMGGGNDNLAEVLKTDLSQVCGLKIFMGSSTGNMLVDNKDTLEAIFREFGGIIALHCEYEPIVKANNALFLEKYGDTLTAAQHPLIRSAEACYASSSQAVDLAEKHGTRIHILHISTEKETSLFRNDIPLAEKKITAEACLHHLWFSDADYLHKGNFIKWNPAVKTAEDREGIWKALLDGRIDVVATDHAPHTFEEKSAPYISAPSGGPLVQHALNGYLEFVKQGRWTLEQLVEKFAHNPARLFRIQKRGFIRPGYFADLVLADTNAAYTVNRENILYKCGWSPFEGVTFHNTVTHTFVNGHLAWEKGVFHEEKKGERLRFDL